MIVNMNICPDEVLSKTETTKASQFMWLVRGFLTSQDKLSYFVCLALELPYSVLRQQRNSLKIDKS